MGLGLGKKGNSRKRLGLRSGAIRPIDRTIRPIDRRGVGRAGMVKPIDTPITGISGTKGRVGKMVKPIDRKVKRADDIYSSGFDF